MTQSPHDKIQNNGDLDLLYDRYSSRFLSISMRYCGNIEDAEDVLHDAFMKIIRHRHTFKSRFDSAFENWMKRIVINTALNYVRDHLKEKRFLDIDKVQYYEKDGEDEETLFDSIREKVNPDQVMEILTHLPAGYRTVFNLYVFEKYTHKEIAKLLDCSENTSKSQLSKARAMLRKKIMEVVSQAGQGPVGKRMLSKILNHEK
ncbi:MAG: RNA polymerase sigma factor [Bacteroidetes bacterium]|nr:RNA polymerase sigma factor [Bacteroidota bacterium]